MDTYQDTKASGHMKEKSYTRIGQSALARAFGMIIELAFLLSGREYLTGQDTF